MKLLFLILFAFSKPNEVREFTHINDKNFVKTEIIILNSQKAMFIPDKSGISQKWETEYIGDNTYKIKNNQSEGVISFTRQSAIMKVGDEFIEFTNKRLRLNNRSF